MGEIAEDMIEGRSCSWCGCYFHDPKTGQSYEHGYPVVCKDCWEPDCGLAKAQVDTF